MRLHPTVWTLVAGALLSACGGGGGGGESSAPPPPVAVVRTGVLVDSPVAGVSYRTATQSGTTNAAGQFNYLAGETVTFSIGSVQFPPVLANGTVTALDMVGTVDPNHPAFVNILVLLQSLDSDGNPGNGITITPAAAAAATAPVNFNVDPGVFAMDPAVLALVAGSGSSNRTPIAADAARAHFQATLNGGAGTPRINVAPFAVAGANQSAHTGTTVHLSGANSLDANGDTLTYQWTFTARPTGSTAELSNANTVNPSFVPDRPGLFTASLVVNDGSLNSTAAAVTITASILNIPPVAHAGTAQSVVTGSTVTLSGAASSDSNGDAITYAWSFASRPAGSNAALADANTVSPRFVPDMPGSYVLSLTVSDAEFTSITPSTVTVTAAPANVAPVASAGTNQDVTTALGAVVNLDGSASSDANGDPISYAWAFVSRPQGSAAVLSRADTANPSFTPDRFGAYVIGLTVSDGRLSSAVSNVTVNVFELNAPPVANAGTAQSVVTGSTVTLNGAASSDANGDLLSYAWTMSSKPTGSTATLTGASTVNPSFVPDLAGSYVFSLTVNDGKVNSTSPSTVTITVAQANVAPVANAGTNQDVTIALGAVVNLDGSASSDANGDPLTYAWAFVSRPQGSTAVLSRANTANPSFTPDRFGSYVIGLTVSDGRLNSAAVNVTVNVFELNAPPVANAGMAQSVVTGSTVTLSGAASSDANGDLLSYAWTMSSKPTGSTATLTGASTVNPSFVPDLAGSYVFSLTVNDGQVNSTSPSTVTITVAQANVAPVANAGTNQDVTITLGAVVNLDGSASSDANGDPITYAWTFVSRPQGSTVVLIRADSVNPSFTPDRFGSYVIGLTVSDGRLNSAAVNVTVNVFELNAPPVANAGTAQSVVTGSTVTLSGAASSDANGDLLSYAWTMSSKPTGSLAALTGASTVNPSFVPDLAGSYVFSLTVNDGKVNSTSPSTVTITVAQANVAPVANAGSAQSVTTGTTVTLSGAASSDANGDPLSFSWSVVSRPTGSNATLTGASTVSPSFVPDVTGSYVFSLTVNDGQVNSGSASTVTVSAFAPNAPPVANAGSAQSVATGATVALSGAASSDANGDPLTYAWTFVSKPAGSAAALSSTTAVSPSFVADVEGSYVFSLVVNDGTDNSATAANVTVTAVTYPSLSLAASFTDTRGGYTGQGVNDLAPPNNTGVVYTGAAKTFGPFVVTGLAGPTAVSTTGTLASYSSVQVNGGTATASATVNNGDLLTLEVDLAAYATDNGPLGYGLRLQPRLRVGSAITVTFGNSSGGGILLCSDPTVPPNVGNSVCR